MMENKNLSPATLSQSNQIGQRNNNNKHKNEENKNFTNPTVKSENELSQFKKLMYTQALLNPDQKENSPETDIKNKLEKDTPNQQFLNGKMSDEAQIVLPGDQILKSLSGELKSSNTVHGSNETLTKLTELVQNLVSKMWVGEPGKINQNSITLKLDQAFLPNTSITLVKINGQLSVHLTTPSEASYQILMSQQRQLISRLEKRKLAEHIDVNVNLIGQEQVNIEKQEHHDIEPQSQVVKMEHR